MLAEPLAIALTNLVASRIRGAVARREMRKFLLDEREVSLTSGRLQAQCASTELGSVRRGNRTHERVEEMRRVGYAREHRHHVDADLDAMRTQPRDGAESCLGRRSARFQPTREL